MADTNPPPATDAPVEAAAPLAPEDDEDYFDDSEDEWANPPAGGAAEVDASAERERSQRATDEVNEDDEDERELAGASVPIVFKLPSGEEVRRPYRMGHTIAHIKVHLEEMNGLPYDKTVLKLNGDVCIDPLSLNDLPFKAGEDNIVTVELSA
jgi:hypothetical protein